MMRPHAHPGSGAAPPIRLIASDEEVVVHVAGFAVLRATYEAEGYYDEGADGDPEEEDLFRIEVLDRARAAVAVEAMDGETVERLADLGMRDPTLLRLLPSARRDTDADAPSVVTRYLLALAAALIEAPGPAARQHVLEASAGWPAPAIEDRFQALPAEWRTGFEPGS